MCSVCGLPATHTGATTIFLLHFIPFVIIYCNAWFISTRLLLRNKCTQIVKETTSTFSKFSRATFIDLISYTFVFLLISSSPLWLDVLYWQTNSETIFQAIDLFGPRILSSYLLILLGILYLYYFYKIRKSKYLWHLGFLCLVEALFLIVL